MRASLECAAIDDAGAITRAIKISTSFLAISRGDAEMRFHSLLAINCDAAAISLFEQYMPRHDDKSTAAASFRAMRMMLTLAREGMASLKISSVDASITTK